MKKLDIPKTLEECLVVDDTANEIEKWAILVKKIGFWILIGMAVIGFFTSYSIATINEYNYFGDVGINFTLFLTSIITWSVYIIIEYCIYNIIYVLLKSLASIVQNKRTMTSVAVYRADKELSQTSTETHEDNQQ